MMSTGKKLLFIGLIVLAIIGFCFTLHTHKRQQVVHHKLSAIQYWEGINVKKGDTFYDLMKRAEMSDRDIAAIDQNKVAHTALASLKPTQMMQLGFDKKNQLIALKYPVDAANTLIIYKDHNQFKAHLKTIPYTKALIFRHGRVQTSLNQAAKNAGLTPRMYSQLTNVFAGSINFSRDIRKGDHFSVLYNEYYLNGKKSHPGNIVAATFTHGQKTYRAFRYSYPHDHTGYYTLDGHGIEPLFLHAPVHYKYISSRFTYHRLDPYLHVWRPHLGVDYAANWGTPVKAIGDGKVIFAGRDNGYGNAIMIRFSKHYKALYGHLERFAHHLHVNEYVHKGQIIGYVGSTGWSTGPHLHFGFYVDGIPRNFLKFKVIGGKSVPVFYLKQYEQHAQNLLSELKFYSGIQS